MGAGDLGDLHLATLGGRAVLAWSFEVLSDGGCRPLVVVVPPSSAQGVRALVGARARVVTGSGSRRAAIVSVLAGVDADRVVIHDATRPFATAAQVRAVVRALDGADGAVAAVPVKETLKLVEGEVVATTVARTHLWHPQTPQAYRTAVLRRALRSAEEGETESGAVRAAGGRTVLVPGSSKNIKVTSEDDLRLAEAIARAL